MRNVHEFDGKVPMRLETEYKEEEMKNIINDAGFLKTMRPDAQWMANQILVRDCAKNRDVLNRHMDARQMFVALLEKIANLPDKEDKELFQRLLEEQLLDMKNLGQCPQGRTIRLWQLLQSLQ